MLDVVKLPRDAKNPMAWMLTHFLMLLAWIPTLTHVWSMPAAHMHGPMGMSLLAFLPFWTLMMAAMMLPALSPICSLHLQALSQRTDDVLALLARLGCFLLGYLLIWAASGFPVYALSLLGYGLARGMPVVGWLVGVLLLVAIGLYQLTPLAGRYLRHCNPALPCAMSPEGPDLLAGLRHGLHCLGACGPLMLVMVVVGLMNLPWMLLLTLLVFFEKTWDRGQRLCLAVGAGLLLFALLAAFQPALMPGFTL